MKEKRKPYTTLLNIFAGNMKRRFRTKAVQGWTGWDDPDIIMRDTIVARIMQNLTQDTKNGEVDAANLCLFLWAIKNQSEKKKGSV